MDDSTNLLKALNIADQILAFEPNFFQVSGRHQGIFHPHSEIWCAHTFSLQLAKSGVSSGAVVFATTKSPLPLRDNESIQIEARAPETMHITFNVEGIKWLMIVTYDCKGLKTSSCFLIDVGGLIKIANAFESEYGPASIPLRWRSDKEKLRLEWNVLWNSDV